MIKQFQIRDYDNIPQDLVNGIIYRSKEYETAIHLCACGCGSQTVTPFQNGWQITGPNESPTINPSIGNMRFPCGSHYWIKNGEVKWC